MVNNTTNGNLSVEMIQKLLAPKDCAIMLRASIECPDECIEPVGTLVYAAGKFPDILELRMLRDTFKERYRKSLEREGYGGVEEMGAAVYGDNDGFSYELRNSASKFWAERASVWMYSMNPLNHCVI